MGLENIVTLSRDGMERHLAEILAIDRGVLGEAWDRSHFLLDQPGKWQLSRLALDDDGAVAGFLVASQKALSAHVHRIAVAERCRRRGLGIRLMASVAAAAQERGLDLLTCKVHERNGPSQKMMARLGLEAVLIQGDNLCLQATPATILGRFQELRPGVRC